MYKRQRAIFDRYADFDIDIVRQARGVKAGPPKTPGPGVGVLAAYLVGVAALLVPAMLVLRRGTDDRTRETLTNLPVRVEVQAPVCVHEIIKLIIPVAMLLASLFVTARLSAQGEWTAFKSGGVSLYRLLVPYIGVALVISAMSVYFNGWIVPSANKKKFTIERVYLHKDVVNASGANIYVQDSPTRILSLGYFDDTRNIASRVSIRSFRGSSPPSLMHSTTIT